MPPDEPVNARLVVELNWPYDGPHTADLITSAGLALEYVMRYLNNATRRPAALEWAATTTNVLGSLHAVASLQRQLLLQQIAALEWQLRPDNPTPLYLWDESSNWFRSPQDAVNFVVARLKEAEADAQGLQRTLQQAASGAGHLANREPRRPPQPRGGTR